MPLYQEWSPDDHSLAAIWRIEEEEAFFLSPESVRKVVQPEQIRHPRRRLEHFGGRFLLQHLKEDFPLHHIAADIHDKPRLPENRYFFSISHSFPYVAAVISEREECGIDIQVWHPRIERIAHMFLSETEQQLCLEDGRLMTLAWCAKEAAYKWNGRRGADFIRDLPLCRLDADENAARLSVGYESFRVDMSCFGSPVASNASLYNDFALSYIIQSKTRENE
jgi:phosphopantetheinyl transferase